jgi:mannosylglycoprotein endo-beta-mannosidase
LGFQPTRREQERGELLILKQTEEEILLTLDQMQRKVSIEATLLSMMEEEELYSHKRAHGEWLHKGDNNTKFFHMIANGRRRKNTIMYFNSEEGRIEGEENLLKHATEYYKTLFGHGFGNTVSLDPDLWVEGEMVSDLDNEETTKLFSETEIKGALDQMEKNKAVGPDGIPIEFYQITWGS